MPDLGTIPALLSMLNEDLAHPLDPRAVRACCQATELFGAAERLIVYGSLAPGRVNHHQLLSLDGEWTHGWITGDLLPTGWGADLGHGAIRLRAGGARVPAWLLRSSKLPESWPRLDEYEGPAYSRVLAPFEGELGIIAVGYLYAAAGGA